ncbi:hypothetical protein NDU88_004537 [Pleurodeles waltl]|uniref:Uncharacterized protein n=1 Tax=Pleurodeles waltl TaxID=8319 RepID=A0AAV7SJ43_PLEWA|nr:hypothetical protein NDU88_004537 [Pleurodeles waltl]
MDAACLEAEYGRTRRARAYALVVRGKISDVMNGCGLQYATCPPLISTEINVRGMSGVLAEFSRDRTSEYLGIGRLTRPSEGHKSVLDHK